MNKAYTYSFSNIYIYIAQSYKRVTTSFQGTGKHCSLALRLTIDVLSVQSFQFHWESRYRNVTIIISTIIRNQSIRFKYKSYFHSPICYFHLFLFMKKQSGHVLSDSVYIMLGDHLQNCLDCHCGNVLTIRGLPEPREVQIDHVCLRIPRARILA